MSATAPKLVRVNRTHTQFVINPYPIPLKGLAHGLRLHFAPYELEDEERRCYQLIEAPTADLMFENEPRLELMTDARGYELVDAINKFLAEGASARVAFKKAWRIITKSEAPDIDRGQLKAQVERQVTDRLKALRINLNPEWPFWWAQMVAQTPALKFEDWREYERDPAQTMRDREVDAERVAARLREGERRDGGVDSLANAVVASALTSGAKSRRAPRSAGQALDESDLGPIIKGPVRQAAAVDQADLDVEDGSEAAEGGDDGVDEVARRAMGDAGQAERAG